MLSVYTIAMDVLSISVGMRCRDARMAFHYMKAPFFKIRYYHPKRLYNRELWKSTIANKSVGCNEVLLQHAVLYEYMSRV